MGGAFETASSLLLIIFGVVTAGILTQSLRGGNTAALVNGFADLAVPLIVVVVFTTILHQFVDQING
jgi:hypothetical protein